MKKRKRKNKEKEKEKKKKKTKKRKTKRKKVWEYETFSEMPSWIEEDNLINEGDVAIKHCRIRVLHKTPKEAIFGTTRMVWHRTIQSPAHRYMLMNYIACYLTKV